MEITEQSRGSDPVDPRQPCQSPGA